MSNPIIQNVSEFRKDLKKHLGVTKYGNGEIVIHNHSDPVAWVTSPDKKDKLKPFEKLLDRVDDQKSFIEDFVRVVDTPEDISVKELLAVIETHLSTKVHPRSARKTAS